MKPGLWDSPSFYGGGRVVDATSGLTKDQVLAAMDGHVLGEGELVGTYER